MKKTFMTIAATACIYFTANAQQADMFSACSKGDLEGVKKAVDGGADVKTPEAKSGQNALAYAFFYPEITKYLLEKGCDPNGGNYPALVSASSVGSYEVMKLLLENGAKPDKTGAGESPLLKVVQMTNCVECAELLLAKGADKNTTGSNYGNLIGVYASYGLPKADRKEAMIKYADILKKYGVTVPDWYINPSEKLNAAPEDMLKVLLKQGLDINMPEKNLVNPKEKGQAPIFTAMNVGKNEIIKSLLDNGADYNAIYDVIDKGFTYWKADGGYTALMYACVKKYSDAVKQIAVKTDIINHTASGQTISNGGMIYSFTGLSAIYLAIMNNDTASVKALANSNVKWGEFVLKALPGQKFESSYGSKPSGKLYNFGTIGGKKGQSTLTYTPSLYAAFLEQNEMAEFLKSKGL